VSKCLQSWLKIIPVLSSEIGDIFCPGKADNIEESFNLIKKQSILLARSIKPAHKKANLCLSRLFSVFEVGQNFLTI